MLSHADDEGQERPVAYGSRSLTTAERNYSQTDREALAVVFGLKKFHHYIYGRNIKIYTDHKPLLGLFDNKKPIPKMVSPRVLRWSLMLAAYHYQLLYRPGKQMGNADGLSRLPLLSPNFDVPQLGEVFLLEGTPEGLVKAEEVAKMTRKDQVLSTVMYWVLHGWPEEKPKDLFSTFYSRREELSVYNGCLLWGHRVVVPKKLQENVLKILHASHPGVVRMKGLARSYVWWQGLDQQIEERVRCCTTCQETRNAPVQAPIHPWEWTVNPWSRLHVDFAGPFEGKIFFIVVDSHSKWVEVRLVKTTSAAEVIRSLRELFATHGVPDVLVSDNGAAFTSAEF